MNFQLAAPINQPERFLHFAIDQKVLLVKNPKNPDGFKTKAGRLSPYFFNAGLFNDGESLWKLADFYADAILTSGVEFDMLFGPAYKGIPLVATIAVALAKKGRNVPFAYNRKEIKDHGEGGIIIGAPLQGRVLIVDDVISAGTSVRESAELILAASATLAGLTISLDRQEKGLGDLSAVQEVERDYGVPTVAISTRRDLISLFERTLAESGDDEAGEILEKLYAYSNTYGV